MDKSNSGQSISPIQNLTGRPNLAGQLLIGNTDPAIRISLEIQILDLPKCLYGI